MAVLGYNGQSLSTDPTRMYMKLVAGRLQNLSTHFVGKVFDNSNQFIEKLIAANDHRKVLQFKKSPSQVSQKLGQLPVLQGDAELRIIDSSNNVTGLVNGVLSNDVPNSYYDPDTDEGVIFFPTDIYTYKIVGEGGLSSYNIDLKNTDTNTR